MRVNRRMTATVIACGTAALLGVGIYAAIPAAAAAPTAKHKCTITGTKGNDYLKGTSGDDVICGLGGDDLLVGFGGTDVLVGGPGADWMSGGPGEDTLIGGPGEDTDIDAAPSLGSQEQPNGDWIIKRGFANNIRPYDRPPTLVLTAAGGTDCTDTITKTVTIDKMWTPTVPLFYLHHDGDCDDSRASAHYTMTLSGNSVGDIWFIASHRGDTQVFGRCYSSVLECNDGDSYVAITNHR
jgi:hypothetical protein